MTDIPIFVVFYISNLTICPNLSCYIIIPKSIYKIIIFCIRGISDICSKDFSLDSSSILVIE